MGIDKKIFSSKNTNDILDLSTLEFNGINQTSYGILPKTLTGNYFIKLPVFNDYEGFYGFEPIYEELAFKIGKNLRFNVQECFTKEVKVKIKNRSYITLASISERFKENYISIEKFSIINNYNLNDFLKNEKYSKSLQEIILFDFIINQVDRHGRNIELNENRFSPIFDNSYCLFSKIDDNALNDKLIKSNFKANNFLGFSSLKENLKFVNLQTFEYNEQEIINIVNHWHSRYSQYISDIRKDFIISLLLYRLKFINYVINEKEGKLKWI